MDLFIKQDKSFYNAGYLLLLNRINLFIMQAITKVGEEENTSLYVEHPSPIRCGKCPEGYYGNGMFCKPRCTRLRCKIETEYCSAPDTCTRMHFIFYKNISSPILQPNI